MKSTNKCIVGYWHYGVLLTYLSVFSAIASIALAARGYVGFAVLCLIFCGLFDAFDGAVARTRKNRTDDDKLFGIQIDSLADILAFGVTPIVIGLAFGLKQWYFIVLYCLFALCGLVRLAYFNVTELQRAEGEPRAKYEGLPITSISVLLPLFYLVATMLASSKGGHPGVAKAVMGVCYGLVAVMFVARIKIPKLHKRGLVVLIVLATIVFVLLFLLRYFVFGIHSL